MEPISTTVADGDDSRTTVADRTTLLAACAGVGDTTATAGNFGAGEAELLWTASAMRCTTNQTIAANMTMQPVTNTKNGI